MQVIRSSVFKKSTQNKLIALGSVGLICLSLLCFAPLSIQAKTVTYKEAAKPVKKPAYTLPVIPQTPPATSTLPPLQQQASVNTAVPSLINDNAMPQLPAMEQAWLGASNNNTALPVNQRLGLLEAFIFGAPKADSLGAEQRYQSLLKVYEQTRLPAQTADADLDQVEATPAPTKAVSKSPAKSARKPVTSYYAPVTSVPAASNSPKPAMLATLETLEQRIMGQTSPQFSIEERLDRLESNLYGAPLVGPVQERLAALEQRLAGTPQASQPVASTNIPPPFVDNAVDMTGANNYGNSPTLTGQLSPLDRAKLEGLEKQVFKQTFPAKADDERLGRLEMSVFNQSSPNTVDPAERLTRLEAVIAASPSNGGVHDVNRNNALQLLIPFALGALMILL